MNLAVELYDQLLRELITGVGAALFVANAFALLRRTRGPDEPAGRRDGEQLTRAPIARTVTFMLIGLVVMVWGIASLLG